MFDVFEIILKDNLYKSNNCPNDQSKFASRLYGVPKTCKKKLFNLLILNYLIYTFFIKF